MSQEHEANERLFLEAVDARINEVLNRSDEILPKSADLLSAVARHLCLTGHAKRVRPLLTYYFGLALEVDPTRLIDAAAASELLHSASLLHDDVVDDATMRRGNPSANTKWSNSVAVLSGNYLLSIAFELLRDYPVELTRDGVRVISQMTKAAIAEIEIRSDVSVDVSVWREIAIGKTGALFALCLLAAARAVGSADAASRAIRCGNHIGVVFQMTDDVLDIVDTSGLKNRYSDFINKEPSLPIILAAKDLAFRQALVNAWSAENVALNDAIFLGKLAANCGAILQTRDLMLREVAAAIDSLGSLAETVGGQKITFWLKHLSERSQVI